MQWNVRVYDLLTGTREWKIDRIYGFVFPVIRRKAPTHDSCCGHTGSLAWNHIEHTSHHSIWHAGNVFATYAGAYRGKEEGGWERGDCERPMCYIRITCALMRGDRRIYACSEHHSSVSLNRKLCFYRVTTNREMKVAQYTYIYILHVHSQKNISI